MHNKDFVMKIIYSFGHEGKRITQILNGEKEDGQVRLQVEKNGNEAGFSIFFSSGVTLHHVSITRKYDYPDKCRIFCNGFQSWSVTREYAPFERSQNLKPLGHLINKAYALDRYNGQDKIKAIGKKGTFLSHTYTYIKDAYDSDDVLFLGSLSEKSGFTMYYHDVKQGTIVLEKECEGLNDVNKYLFYVYEQYGNFDKALNGYLKACMRKKTGSFVRYKYIQDKNRKYTGFTSWYNFYQDINQRIIQRNLYYYTHKNPNTDIFQIDDGFQRCVGDWFDVDKAKFPDGMKKIALKTSNKGVMPGLWLAPFTAEKKSDIFKKHNDWILKDEKGRPYKAGSGWSGFYALDTDNREVQNYIKKVMDTAINEWGYKFLKLDFLYCACMLPRNNKTRGQLMCEAMDFLNETCKDAVLLGCGVPLGPAFWNVDFCRIGADISLQWDNRLYMRVLVRERVSTRNSVVNTVFRSHLDKKVFVNDPDVFMLRTENCFMTDEQKEILGTINSAYGSLLFTSDQVGEYDKHQDALFKKINKGMKKGKREYIDEKSNLIIEYEDSKIVIPLKDHKKPYMEKLKVNGYVER